MPTILRQFFGELRHGDGFDRRTLIRYSAILLVCELLAAAFFVAGTYGLIVPVKPNTTDFVSFYSAGKLANEGRPELAYNRSAHFAAEEKATEPGIGYVHFYYPPVFIAICAVFSPLPYLLAFSLFVLVPFIPFALLLRRILREQGWAVLIPILAFPATLWTMSFGQDSFLTAALFGGATLFVDRRPLLAGFLFGALCYKPHFGLLLPIALAADKNWRAFAATAASAVTLSLLSLVAFGWRTWQAFFLALGHAHTTYETGTVDHAAFINPFGAVFVLGGSPALAYVVQALAMVAAAALVAYIWRRRLSLPIRAATLTAATIVALPVVLFYDFALAAIAGAWLIRAGQERGFLPWEKVALVMLFLAPTVSRVVAQRWHLPLGPIAALALLGLCLAAAFHELARERAIGTAPSLAG